MRIGMTLPVTEPGWTREIALGWIRRIDEGPFSSLALGQRNAFPSPDLIALLGACAGSTDRVRLVTSIAIVTLQDPVLWAKQLATVDVLCGGRLTVGVGIGGRAEDYRAIGADLRRKRVAALEEDVAIMRRVWAGEKVVEELLEPVGPPPVQQGGPPILAGMLGPKGVANSVRWADGLCGMTTMASAAEVAGAFERFGTAWRDAGRNGEPSLHSSTWFAIGEGSAPRDQMRTHLHRYFNWMPGMRDVMAERGGFTGTAAELRALMQEMKDVGTEEFHLIPTSIDPDEVNRAADALADFAS